MLQNDEALYYGKPHRHYNGNESIYIRLRIFFNISFSLRFMRAFTD